MASRISFYAVKQGNSPGIYTEWSEAELSLRGHPEPLFKTFRTQLAAEAFLNGWENGSGGAQSVPFGFGGPEHIPAAPVTQLGLPFQQHVSQLKYKDRKSKRLSRSASASPSLTVTLSPTPDDSSSSSSSSTTPQIPSSSRALPRQTSSSPSLAPPLTPLSPALDPVGGRRRSPLIQIVVEEEEEEEGEQEKGKSSFESPVIAESDMSTSDGHAEGSTTSGTGSSNSDDVMTKTAHRKSSLVSGLGVAFGGLLQNGVGPMTPPGSPELHKDNPLWDAPSGATVPGAWISESKPSNVVKPKKSNRFSSYRLSGLFNSSPDLTKQSSSQPSSPSSPKDSPPLEERVASPTPSSSASSSAYATPSDRTPTASAALWGPPLPDTVPQSPEPVLEQPTPSPSTPNLNTLLSDNYTRPTSPMSSGEPQADYYSPFASAATPVFSRSASSGSVILPMRSPSASGADLLRPPSIRSLRPVSSVSSFASFKSQTSTNDLPLPKPRFYSYTSEFGSNTSGSSVGGSSVVGSSAPSSIRNGVTSSGASSVGAIKIPVVVPAEKEKEKKKKGFKHKMKKMFGGGSNSSSSTKK